MTFLRRKCISTCKMMQLHARKSFVMTKCARLGYWFNRRALTQLAEETFLSMTSTLPFMFSFVIDMQILLSEFFPLLHPFKIQIGAEKQGKMLLNPFNLGRKIRRIWRELIPSCNHKNFTHREALPPHPLQVSEDQFSFLVVIKPSKPLFWSLAPSRPDVFDEFSAKILPIIMWEMSFIAQGGGGIKGWEKTAVGPRIDEARQKNFCHRWILIPPLCVYVFLLLRLLASLPRLTWRACLSYHLCQNIRADRRRETCSAQPIHLLAWQSASA